MTVEIVEGATYKIRTTQYFLEKYGDEPLEFKVIGEDIEEHALGGWWGFQKGSPVALLYAMRSLQEGIPLSGRVFYGHIGHYRELVHESEFLEMIS